MAYLILVRHGKSDWNALGVWTGWKDVPLSKTGEKESERAAKQLRDIEIHKAHSSRLTRAKKSLEVIKKALGISHIPTASHKALNERHYGIFVGKNKWQIKEEVGEEEFQKIRRGWNHPIIGGETLEDVYKRVVPYYEKRILNDLKKGKNVIVVAHGNSLRALIKYLEELSEDQVVNLEVGIAEVHIYEINEGGKVVSKELRAKNPKKGKI